MSISKRLFHQSAVGFEHQSDLSKHGSQTDAAKGFGGKHGIQKDRMDKVDLIKIFVILIVFSQNGQ